MAGDAAFFMIERTAPFGVGMAIGLELDPLPQRAEETDDRIDFISSETVHHLRHGRTFAAGFGIFQKLLHPVAIHPA